MSKAAVRNLVQSAARDLAGTGVHVAMVTIAGVVGSDGFAPEAIAERFWTLHEQPRDAWDIEITHEG
jgi:NAD(P)-dependent dehydrogenase (short-subunit alcohol dehydrogenase family)